MFEQQVQERFYLSLINYLEEGDRAPGIHVSDLVQDCMRRSYYGKVYGGGYDVAGAMRMAIGKKMHEIPLSKDSELEIDHLGIHGSADEYFQGIVVEKKTTRKIPRQPHDTHKRQLMYYAALLADMGKPIVAGVVLYEDVDTAVSRSFPVSFSRPLDKVLKEMLEKKAVLDKALKDEVPPKRNVGWICTYCDHPKRCFVEDRDIPTSGVQSGT